MPSLGTQIRSSWYYFEVPFSDASQQTPEFNIQATGQPYLAIERFLKLHCIDGERKDLVDRARIYRVPDNKIGLFDKNTSVLGGRILVANGLTYTLVDTDPSGNRATTRDWTPL